MSLNNVIAFALLLKKITRKGSIGKKHFQQRMRKTKTKTEPTAKEELSSASDSFSSSSEEEEEEEAEIIYREMVDNRSSIIVSTTSIKSSNQMKVALLFGDKIKSEAQNVSTNSLLSIAQVDVKIRDFAYPVDSPLHFGKPLPLTNQSTVSLSSPDFNGRDARVLFDFAPETEYEIALKAGQTVWVQYRQCPGWLIADVHDETGLIPESYVEFI